MSKGGKRTEALQLRKQGTSIKDIAGLLSVSRSTASVWCQEIILTDNQKELLRKKQILSGSIGRQKGADVNRQKRLDALKQAEYCAEKTIKMVSDKELLFLGLGLYWGEGIKSRSGPAAIVNSDPKVLRAAKLWFLKCLGVSSGDFRPYVYISQMHKERGDIIMDYWTNELDIPINQFKNPIFIKQKPHKKYENHDSYYGVVSLRIKKSSNLKYKIKALLEEVNKRLE